VKKYPYETATEEQRKIGSLWWNVHHEIHLEPLTEPIENRVRYIKEHKPKHEIETRLKNLAPVLHPERLPETLIKARDAYNKARIAYNEAKAYHNEVWDACVKAWAALKKARIAYEPELTALHCEEYPDTTWNGKSIF